MDPSHGYHNAEDLTNTCMKSTKKKKYLPMTKGWQVVQASRNRSRQSNRNNRAHHHILPPTHSFRLTNGSGMICLPSVTSWENSQHGESRRFWRKCRDITVFTEKIMERLIGTHCCQSCAAISKKKMLGVSRIHNGWISYIEEATRRDPSIVWTVFPLLMSGTWLLKYPITSFFESTQSTE